MTVSTQYQPFTFKPGAAMTAEAIPWQFLAGEQIVVTHIAAVTAAETVLVLGDDYSISGSGPDGTGSVTALAAWPVNDDFRVERATSLEQEYELPPFEAIRSSALERENDRQLMALQEQVSTLTRAVLAPVGQDAPKLDIAGLFEGDILEYRGGKIRRFLREAFAGKFFAGDASGRPVPASGFGADAALRTDIAAPDGSALMGFSHTNTYAPGTVGRHLKGLVCVTDAPFNAVGNGVANDTAAFAAARAVTNRYHIPSGSYVLDASPDPFLDAFTASSGVTLIVGGVSYNCSNAFAGPLRYVPVSASKMDIVHAKTGNVIQYWQNGASGTATGFFRGLAFTTNSHFIQAQPATNGGSTDMLFQRSTLNADPAGNRFNITFEESTDRLIFSVATTASGPPNFDSFMRIVGGASPTLEFPAYQPRFSQGWRVTTRADGNFVLQAVPTADRVQFRNTDGTITYLTMTQAGALGFFGAGGVNKPSVIGSRGGNAALASLLTALANLGLVFNDSTA